MYYKFQILTRSLPRSS